MREPIYSDMQYPHYRDSNGPIPLAPFADQYIDIVTQLRWRFFDFCRIHHIIYFEIDRINKILNEIPKEYMVNSGEESLEDLARIRLRQSVLDKDIENKRIHSFTDQMMVVGLWAISEQFMAKIYRRHASRTSGVLEKDVKPPYRWSDFKKYFNECGINLELCENYTNADECRELNNSIKHDPIVGDSLIKYQFFKTLIGQDLENMELDMQRYLNGVSDFLGSLIEHSQKIIRA
ncbi:hypothetical protein [Nitrosomonas sp. Is37]|uniref:hypothetical protein n=1 Tax=Nitrosomonas sp. Is37 TaxID=3080535 RepID=UPI00294AF3B2|nr:hypothetical protein [Nitrosomonas sp. Is37]MDV6345101.1 hypothetical protein [Nitrosomonas sp. Is37]